MNKVLLVFSVCFLGGLFGCSHSAEVTAYNYDDDGWAMNITIDGEAQSVNAFSSKAYTVSWFGYGTTEKTILMEARYVSHGGYASRSHTVEDGGAYSWSVYFCPGYYP